MQTTEIALYTANLARSQNGNWSLTMPHVDRFPPIAFPAVLTAEEAQHYGRNLIDQSHIPTPLALNWERHGVTVTNASNAAPAFIARWRVTIENLDHDQ